MLNRILLSSIKEQGLKFFVKQHSANFIEVSVVIPYTLFGDVLAKAISEDPENMFVFNLLDSTNWDICLQHSLEELVATGINNVFISVSFDENALMSVALSHDDHARYTKLWREQLPYGSKYSKDAVIEAARNVYSDNPVLFDIAMTQIKWTK